MRLAIISSQYPFGAQESFLDTELQALSRRLESIIVIPTTPKQREPFYHNPAATLRLAWFAPATLWGALVELARRPAAVSAIVAELFGGSRPAIVLKNLGVLPMALALAGSLRRLRIEHVHAYWLSTPSTVAYVAARLAGIPFSATAHLWDIYEDNAAAAKVRSATFVRAISERGRNDLGEIAGAEARSRIAVLHVGVRVPEPAPLGGRPAGPFTLLCAANFVPKKGHRDLLRALASVRRGASPVRCVFAGDGPLLDEMKALAESLDLPNVVFSGRRVHGELLAEIAAGEYDAGILLSIEQRRGEMEGIPVTLMELMAAGVPVISTRTGSIPELVDERSGILVEQSDIPAMTAAIESLAASPERRRELGAAGRKRVERDFNIERIGDAYALLLRDGV